MVPKRQLFLLISELFNSSAWAVLWLLQLLQISPVWILEDGHFHFSTSCITQQVHLSSKHPLVTPLRWCNRRGEPTTVDIGIYYCSCIDVHKSKYLCLSYGITETALKVDWNCRQEKSSGFCSSKRILELTEIYFLERSLQILLSDLLWQWCSMPMKNAFPKTQVPGRWVIQGNGAEGQW